MSLLIHVQALHGGRWTWFRYECESLDQANKLHRLALAHGRNCYLEFARVLH